MSNESGGWKPKLYTSEKDKLPSFISDEVKKLREETPVESQASPAPVEVESEKSAEGTWSTPFEAVVALQALRTCLHQPEALDEINRIHRDVMNGGSLEVAKKAADDAFKRFRPTGSNE